MKHVIGPIPGQNSGRLGGLLRGVGGALIAALEEVSEDIGYLGCGAVCMDGHGACAVVDAEPLTDPSGAC